MPIATPSPYFSFTHRIPDTFMLTMKLLSCSRFHGFLGLHYHTLPLVVLVKVVGTSNDSAKPSFDMCLEHALFNASRSLWLPIAHKSDNRVIFVVSMMLGVSERNIDELVGECACTLPGP